MHKHTIFVRKNRDGRAPELVKLSTEYEEKGSVEADGFSDLQRKLKEQNEDLPVTTLNIGDVIRVSRTSEKKNTDIIYYIVTEYRFVRVSVC